MIPTSKITPAFFRKMFSAGFSKLYIGYEAVTDGLLKKMRKENNFSENILFVKNALKNKIMPQVHIIQGIPPETEADIIESISNLHFLRFYFSEGTIEFAHKFIPLNLYKGTEYFSMMSSYEKENFNRNPVSGYLPESFINAKERFDFFSFRRDVLKNNDLWHDFAAIERFYRKNKFSYIIKKNKSSLKYREFMNDAEIKTLTFDHPVYYDILNEADEKIVTFDQMFLKLSEKYPALTSDELKKYLSELKRYYILYYNNKSSAIVSLIYLHGE